MENLWIFYSLGWLMTLGMWDYIKKLILSKGINKEVFLLVCFTLYVPVFWINMLINGTGNIDPYTLKNGIIFWLSNTLAPVFVLISLKYLDTAFSLVSIRVLSSFFVLFIGTQIIWDQLSIIDYIWFFLWVSAVFLLSWFEFGKKYDLHRKWIVWTIIAMAGIIFWHSYFKHIVPNINVHDFMPIQFTTTFFGILFYIVIRWKLKDINKKEVVLSLPYAWMTVVVFALYFLYFLPNIYLNGTLSLGYKMLSYSLIVPIALSIIFLWDSLTKKRIIAFILTIISIFLFIL